MMSAWTETTMPETSLELLQAMVERVLTGQRRIEVKLDRISDALADLNTEGSLAGVNRRLDRLDGRMERIDRRRLDLVASRFTRSSRCCARRSFTC
jgi:hypothetical protein